MFSASFAYARPSSVEEAIQLLQASNGEARILAGGHSLLPLMKLRLAEPGQLIDIGKLTDTLGYVRRENGSVAIGALTTHHRLETSDELKHLLPAIPEAAALIGDAQVRNRGTIGGSLAHADPAADLPAVMLALGAEMVAQGPSGRRVIPADEFFVEMLTSALKPDELLVEVRLPVAVEGTGMAYRKFEQPASGYALVGVAAAIQVNGGSITRARIGITGASSRPYRANAVEDALTGKPANADTLREAAARATDGIEVAGDLHADPEYRAHLATVFTRRALEAALERAQA